MSLSAAAPPMSLVRRYWRDRALWTTIADVFAILAALALRTAIATMPVILAVLSEVPVIGHGTGSLRGLFERAATDYSDSAPSKIISNPHNQTLNIAVQWGMIGVLLLYAMWLVHLLLFRGEGLVAWIGLLVVVQNMFTSLFNSHLFDFHEGWMYVLGVGVAGGMTLAAKQRGLPAAPVIPR